MSAGKLTEKVVFAKRQETNPDAPEDYGNVESAWVDQFEVWAEHIHLRGGEAVMAARLQGRHTQVIRVRASAQSRAVTADWRARDARTGAVFNIRDVTPSPDRAWIDLLCEGGVA